MRSAKVKLLHSSNAIFRGVFMSGRHATDNENGRANGTMVESRVKVGQRSRSRWCREPEEECDLDTLGRRRLLLRAREGESNQRGI